MNINEIEEKLSQVLKPGRYRHSQGVAYTAANMAAVFDQNTEKAFRAGMLHDCAKGYSLKEQEGFCRTYGICLDDILPDSPQLMHSALAPHIAEEFYQEKDPDILSAIECHTTGKTGMKPLEQIIFIADYIEPNRKMIPGLPAVRRLAFQDLDLCTRTILKNTIEYLESQGQKIGHETIETYEYYQT